MKVNPSWKQSGVYYFHTKSSDFNQFVSCGLAEKSMDQFSAKLKREKSICMKVKVKLIRLYLSLNVVLVDFIFSTNRLA